MVHSDCMGRWIGASGRKQAELAVVYLGVDSIRWLLDGRTGADCFNRIKIASDLSFHGSSLRECEARTAISELQHAASLKKKKTHTHSTHGYVNEERR